MWGLKFEAGSFARAARALNHWAISPAPVSFFDLKLPEAPNADRNCCTELRAEAGTAEFQEHTKGRELLGQQDDPCLRKWGREKGREKEIGREGKGRRGREWKR